MNTVHDGITGINTGCAVYTFQLCAIAYINTCWAYLNTGIAINTVAMFMLRLYGFHFL